MGTLSNHACTVQTSDVCHGISGVYSGTNTSCNGGTERVSCCLDGNVVSNVDDACCVPYGGQLCYETNSDNHTNTDRTPATTAPATDVATTVNRGLIIATLVMTSLLFLAFMWWWGCFFGRRRKRQYRRGSPRKPAPKPPTVVGGATRGRSHTRASALTLDL